MSNEVYGFADFNDPTACPSDRVAILKRSTSLGIEEIAPNELYNFPSMYQPASNSMVFMVTDRAGSRNATYLIDFENYSPNANIGLPVDARERLELLIAVIESLFTACTAGRVCIAVTDSSQIEECKTATPESIRSLLRADFEQLAPPCCLYIIEHGAESTKAEHN